MITTWSTKSDLTDSLLTTGAHSIDIFLRSPWNLCGSVLPLEIWSHQRIRSAMLSSSLQLMQRMVSNLVARIADSTFSAHGYGCVEAWTLPVCGPSCSVVVFQRAARSTRGESFAFIQVGCRRSVGYCDQGPVIPDTTLADFVPMNMFSLNGRTCVPHDYPEVHDAFHVRDIQRARHVSVGPGWFLRMLRDAQRDS